jgi:hypothetical protein
MLTVIWGITGFHVVDLMTERHNHNTQYFLSHILERVLLQDFQKVANRILIGSVCILTTVPFTAQRSLTTFSLKILSFEYSIRFTVLTWHLLTSGFADT